MFIREAMSQHPRSSGTKDEVPNKTGQIMGIHIMCVQLL